MDRDEMSNICRGPPIDNPIKFRFIWQSGFRGECFFLNRPIRNKNRLGQPCETDRDEMNNLYREPSIYASYQLSHHLGKRFYRRRVLEIDQSETRIVCGAMFDNGSE